MFDGEFFIFECLAVNGFPACAITSCDVTTLEHEVRDHAVEDVPLVMQRDAPFSFAFFACKNPNCVSPFTSHQMRDTTGWHTCAEAAKVLSCQGHNVRVEGELNAAGRFAADGNVKKHTRASSCHG